MTRKPDPFIEASDQVAYLTIELARTELSHYEAGCEIADLVVTEEFDTARRLSDSYEDQTAVIARMKAELAKAKAALKQAVADMADSAEDGMA